MLPYRRRDHDTLPGEPPLLAEGHSSGRPGHEHHRPGALGVAASGHPPLPVERAQLQLRVHHMVHACESPESGGDLVSVHMVIAASSSTQYLGTADLSVNSWACCAAPRTTLGGQGFGMWACPPRAPWTRWRSGWPTRWWATLRTRQAWRSPCQVRGLSWERG